MNKDALKDLCLRYLDGELTEQEAKPFSRLIAESQDAARMLARLSIHDSRFEVTTAFLSSADSSISPSHQLIDDVLRTNEDPMHWASRPPADQALAGDVAANRMSFNQAMSLTGFALRQAAKTGPVRKLAAAAAVALVALVAWQILAPAPSADTQVPDPLATTLDPNNNTAPTQPTPRRSTVATLTAEHDAKWAEGALAPGSPLQVGTRLTLTQGFAEITTHRGAIAILEAPATIELLDSTNALRLHAGKLVGICETESSKGFLVRTPHMDITDLGTRFGVDASQRGQTRVEVFEGEVEVTGLADGETQPPQRLTTGQAVIGTASMLADAELDTKIFATALNLATGMDDLRPHIEGDPVLWGGMAPDDLRIHQQESDLLQLFVERAGVVLAADVPVDTLPGETWPIERGYGQAIVPAGSAVDVYLLHFDNLGEVSTPEHRVRCVIRFDRPILGLIGAQSTLRPTDAGLGRPGSVYSVLYNATKSAVTGGGAGIDAPPFNDTAVLSADGRTLTLDLSVAGGIDQARVLVLSQTAQDETQTDQPH